MRSCNDALQEPEAIRGPTSWWHPRQEEGGPGWSQDGQRPGAPENQRQRAADSDTSWGQGPGTPTTQQLHGTWQRHPRHPGPQHHKAAGQKSCQNIWPCTPESLNTYILAEAAVTSGDMSNFSVIVFNLVSAPSSYIEIVHIYVHIPLASEDLENNIITVCCLCNSFYALENLLTKI